MQAGAFHLLSVGALLDNARADYLLIRESVKIDLMHVGLSGRYLVSAFDPFRTFAECLPSTHCGH